MEISGASSASYTSFRVTSYSRLTPFQVAQAADGQRWARVQGDAKDLEDGIVELRRLLERLRPRTGADAAAAVARSSEGIDIAADARPSVIRSTERVNTDLVTYDPKMPEWTGGSTAMPTIGGTYNGTAAETYTFEVEKASKNPNQPHKIRMYDSQGTKLDLLSVNESDLGVTEFTLSNGLTVTFGTGSFEKNDTFTVDAFTERYATAEPDNPFDGTGSQYPNLQTGMSITDGSFTVNGTTISVSSSDSINSVLQRITDLTDITATFDVATQTVVLTHEENGELPIDLAGDTSGFLQAMKLDGATVELGAIPDADEPMANLSAFAGVTAGDLSVNGVSISIDPAVDSLNDVIARINASGAGVQASVDENLFVTIQNTDPEADLELDGGGTGFFAALNVQVGTYEPTESTRRGRGISATRAREITNAMADVGALLAEIMGADSEGSVLRGALAGFGKDARALVSELFDVGSAKTQHRAHGIRFDLRDGATALFDISASGKRSMAKEIGKDFTSFRDSMLDEVDGGKSFLDQLEALAERMGKRARAHLDLRL